MSKNIFVFLFLFAISTIVDFPLIANATVYQNLQKLDKYSFVMGRQIHGKKTGLTVSQSYDVCKIVMLKYNQKLARGNAKRGFKSFLHYMSPAEVTYCWAGYVGTKSLSKLDEISYLMGKSLYGKNSGLSTAQSYVGCEKAALSYNKYLVSKVKNRNYGYFLTYAWPAEYTYCWVGYLDAAGANK